MSVKTAGQRVRVGGGETPAGVSGTSQPVDVHKTPAPPRADPAATYAGTSGATTQPPPASTGRTADDVRSPLGLRMATLRAAQPVQEAAATPATLSVADIQALQASRGATLTLAQLAQEHPNARINGVGLTLAQLAAVPLNKKANGVELTLGAGTVDKNGDVDVTRLFHPQLKEFNQHLLLHKGDERPVPLEYSLRNGTFHVVEPAHQPALAAAGFERNKDGHVTFDLRDMEQVNRAVRALGVDPADDAAVNRQLSTLGVSVRLSREDQLRRVVCGLLDSPVNHVDLDNRLVASDRVGDHNNEFKATVYASAKVSPEHPEHVVLCYKRFNNQSFSAQGGWVANALGKDRKSQHEGDMEATFVKMGTQSHQLESVLAARHSYGELYDRNAVERQLAATGQDALTVAVSFKAHGGDLAGTNTRKTFAGHGEDGVTAGDWKDHVLPESFPGLADARTGGAEFIPRHTIRLVLEADDQQTLNMKVRLGEQRKGLFGTGVLDMFNDGVRMDRFMGTGWFYRQEALQTGKS